MLFAHPQPGRKRPRIHPVFLPFAGCPHRCRFCDQPSQTGQPVRGLAEIHAELAEQLARLEQSHAPEREIAFYGGTFTALPEPWPSRFLALAAKYRARGLLTRVRCSTRPDAMTRAGLLQLKQQGLDLLELGVQSFDDDALVASGRGYTAEVARAGCELVKEAGLALGVQLLPGLPGDGPGVFLHDCETAASMRPEVARLYPCLVLEGTQLAQAWRKGAYQPWSLEQTRQELAAGLGLLWQAGVQVIRMGLAPEPGLSSRILAGPQHPALGQMVRSLALYEHIRARACELDPSPTRLRYPARHSGEIMGHGGELAEQYISLGLLDISGWEKDQFFLGTEEAT